MHDERISALFHYKLLHKMHTEGVVVVRVNKGITYLIMKMTLVSTEISEFKMVVDIVHEVSFDEKSRC